MSELAPIGHNKPPVILGDYAELKARKEELVGSLDRAPQTIDNEESAQKFTSLAKMMKAAAKDSDNKRTIEKQPYLDAGREVDAFFAAISKPLEEGAKECEKRLGIYVKFKADEERKRALEEARKAREEAEKKAAEAAEMEKYGMDTLASTVMAEAEKSEQTAIKLEAYSENKKELGRIQSDLGKTQIRKKTQVEITDRTKIDYNALATYFSDDAVLAAVKAFAAAGGREIGSGVRIYEDEVVSVR